MDECIDDAQLIKPQTAPTWVTETGAALGEGDGGSGVTEPQQAKYIPRLLVEFYKRRTSQNVQKIFLFEMLDNVDEAFGLLDGNGAERQSYGSLKNTMTLLNDTSTAASTFTADSLTYSLNGATGVSTLLLEKGTSPRQFYLVLWKNVVSPANGSDVTQNVTLSWTGFSSPNVAVYLPLSGSGAVKTGSGKSITLSGAAAVRDHIMIVRIDKP